MRTFRVVLFLSFFAASAFAGDMYVFKRGNNSVMMGGSLERLQSILEWEGDFIWYRLDGQAYLIRDRAVLAEAARAYAPVEAMQPEYEALRSRLHEVERREEVLDRKIDRLSDRDDERLTAAEESQLREYEAAMRVVERELRPLEEEERRLDRKQEALEKVAEKELREIVRRAVAKGVAVRQR